jgi:hypothetical protein
MTEYKYNCEPCDFHDDRKNNYERHIETPKHNKLINADEIRKQEEEKQKKIDDECRAIDELRSDLSKKTAYRMLVDDIVNYYENNFIYIMQEREFIKTEEDIYIK